MLTLRRLDEARSEGYTGDATLPPTGERQLAHPALSQGTVSLVLVMVL
ncbi:hypothetical protein [Thermogemmatispora carboxidivorans]|nr:hypothetical protein [Thermogemmatispora carboxidivorans]